jgi:hypothetical protein
MMVVPWVSIADFYVELMASLRLPAIVPTLRPLVSSTRSERRLQCCSGCQRLALKRALPILLVMSTDGRWSFILMRGIWTGFSTTQYVWQSLDSWCCNWLLNSFSTASFLYSWSNQVPVPQPISQTASSDSSSRCKHGESVQSQVKVANLMNKQFWEYVIYGF